MFIFGLVKRFFVHVRNIWRSGRLDPAAQDTCHSSEPAAKWSALRRGTVMLPEGCRVWGRSPIRFSPAGSRFPLGMRASLRPALLALAGTLVVNATHAQQSGNWYYCDPAHAYYPYVRTCPVPWRAVAPYSYEPTQPHDAAPPAMQPRARAGVPPAPAAPAPSDVQQSEAFRQGQVDRQTWETWFGSLTGDYRSGATYWASQRSLAIPGSCSAVPPSTGADWTAGCFAAQQKLAAPDVRRKTEPNDRLGWKQPGAGCIRARAGKFGRDAWRKFATPAIVNRISCGSNDPRAAARPKPRGGSVIARTSECAIHPAGDIAW